MSHRPDDSGGEASSVEVGPGDGGDYYRAVLDSISDIVAVIAADHTFHYISPAVERVLGHRVAEVVGRSPLDFVHPDDAAYLAQRTARRLRGEPDPDRLTEVRFRHRDGSWRILQVRGQRLERSPGEPVVVLAARDVSDLRQAELALRESEAQLRQAQKLESIGRLAGGVAHDFNNLLNVINGLVYLSLQNLTESSGVREDLHEIRGAVHQAATLTQQLLAFSRRQLLQPRVVDLAAEVRATSQLLGRLIGEDVELVTALRSRGRVLVDPGQLAQVLMNLAVNARDAMPRGGKLVIETHDAELSESSTRRYPYRVLAGPYVELVVRDTGCGMDQATLAQVFEPFFTTKGPGEGTGLGLSMVYGIIKQSGGYIWVDSAPGAGSTFRISLPRVTAEAEQARPTAAPFTGRRGGTILLVEDEPAVRMVTSRILEMNGYRVVAASGGAEALCAMDEHAGELDLVLTDVVMPGTSGAALAEHILARDPGMPIMYMSGYTDDQVIRHGVCRDQVHFLQKPFEPDQLVRRVQEMLRR